MEQPKAKISKLNMAEGVYAPHDFGRFFSCQTTATGQPRLLLGAAGDGSEVMRALAGTMAEPFYLLYILVVSRGEAKEGRYQSPRLDRMTLNRMFNDFGKFWDSDGRHAVWVYSPQNRATIIYDQHNRLYAYGAIDRFVEVLTGLGYQEAPLSAFTIPCPHTHAYFPEWDATARSLHASMTWQRSDLQAMDDE